MKIGIMGGTFNPIHNAHLMMAQAAYEQYKLDEIWFMPSAKPPHKNQDEIAEKVSKSRTAVTNSMRLLKLDKRVQQMMIDDMQSEKDAKSNNGGDDFNE